MTNPYPFCGECIARHWCKAYSGEQPLKEDAPKDWCTAQYRLDVALKLSRLPKSFINANIHHFKTDADNKELYNLLIKPTVDNIVQIVGNGTNFIFHNENTGTGKTYSACTVLNHFIYKTCLTKRMDFETPLGLFIEYPTLIDDLRYRRDDEDVMDTMEQVRTTPLLLLDDVGAGTMSDYSRQQTYMILNYRMNSGLSTIITSNLGLNQLEKDEYLGKRNMSRILSGALPFSVGGKDRRRVT